MTSDRAEEGSDDSLRAAQLYAGAALLLGVATGIQQRNPATLVTILAGCLAVAALVVPRAAPSAGTQRMLTTILAAGIVGEALVALALPPIVEGWFPAYLAATVVMALLSLYLARVRTILLLAIVVGQLVLGALAVQSLVPPYADVRLFQQQGSAALLRGENPYGLRFPNVYGPGTPYYAAEVQIGDRLDFGFPYPPLSLFMALPSYLLVGDYQYGAAVAVALTALLLAFVRRGQVAAGAALLFALSPLTARVVYIGWTESFVGLLLAGAIYVAMRHPRATPVMLGLLIASKQYLLPILVPGLLLLQSARKRVGTIRLLALSLAVAAATIVPFVVWNPNEFFRSVVFLQALQPFRADSQSVPGLLARSGWWVPPSWVAFVVLALAILAVSRWARRTPAGFAGATAIVFISFFLFSKQASTNYFYFVLVALVSAVAATGMGVAAPESGKVGHRPSLNRPSAAHP